MSRLSRFVLISLAFLTCHATWGAESAKPTTLVDLNASASRQVSNDLGRVVVYAEASDSQQSSVARKVNEAINQAAILAKAYATVKVQSAGTNTWPNSDKSGKISGWRMRSSLSLESRDLAALAELLGKLQSTLAVSQLTMQPAPDTRKKAEDATILDAVSAFQARAALVAGHLRKPWKIKQMSINSNNGPAPYLLHQTSRAASYASDASPIPIEAGESQLTVNISGQIELTD